MALSHVIVVSEILCGLVALGLLMSFLCLKHARRVSMAHRWAREREWIGTGIDIAPLKPKVQDVRQDYLGAHPRSRMSGYHRALLGLARHAVGRLNYFHDREAEQPAHR